MFLYFFICFFVFLVMFNCGVMRVIFLVKLIKSVKSSSIKRTFLFKVCVFFVMVNVVYVVV